MNYNNPLVNKIKSYEPPTVAPDPILNTMNNIPANFSSSLYVDAWYPIGEPAAMIGDRYAYPGSQKQVKAGRIKGKILTTSVNISEEEQKAIAKGSDIHATSIDEQFRKNDIYMDQLALKFACGYFTSTTAKNTENGGYDKEAIGIWGLSNNGAVSNKGVEDPSDLNTGAVLNMDLTCVLRGDGQTANNLITFHGEVSRLFSKKDINTKESFGSMNKTLLVSRNGYDQVLNIYKDLIVSGYEQDEQTYAQRLKALGYNFQIYDQFADVQGEAAICSGSLYIGVVGNLPEWKIHTEPESKPFEEMMSNQYPQTRSYVATKSNVVAFQPPTLAMKTATTDTEYTIYKPFAIVKVGYGG